MHGQTGRSGVLKPADWIGQAEIVQNRARLHVREDALRRHHDRRVRLHGRAGLLRPQAESKADHLQRFLPSEMGILQKCNETHRVAFFLPTFARFWRRNFFPEQHHHPFQHGTVSGQFGRASCAGGMQRKPVPKVDFDSRRMEVTRERSLPPSPGTFLRIRYRIIALLIPNTRVVCCKPEDDPAAN